MVIQVHRRGSNASCVVAHLQKSTIGLLIGLDMVSNSGPGMHEGESSNTVAANTFLAFQHGHVKHRGVRVGALQHMHAGSRLD